MSNTWDDYADGWEQNDAVVLYAQKAYESLQKIVALEGKVVLDFGCGTGLLTEKISPKAKRIVAIDPSEKMLAILANKNLANVKTISQELTPALLEADDDLRAGFDLIVASSSLAFVPDYIETLKLLRRMLNKGGSLIQWDWLKEDTDSGVGFSSTGVASALQEVGFSDVSVTIPFEMEGPDGAMPVVMGVATTDG